MANGINRPRKVMTFNANDIMKQRYELSKHLQDPHVDIALFSETHLKPYKRFFYFKLPLSSNRPPPGQKRRNCHWG
jgi:hypothetical protein